MCNANPVLRNANAGDRAHQRREGGKASLRHFQPSRRIKHSAKARRRRKRFSRQNPDQPKRVASLPQQSAGQYLGSCANPATKRGRYTFRGRRELPSCPTLLLGAAGLPVRSCDRGSGKNGAAQLARGQSALDQQAQRLRRFVKKRLRAQNAQASLSGCPGGVTAFWQALCRCAAASFSGRRLWRRDPARAACRY